MFSILCLFLIFAITEKQAVSLILKKSSQPVASLEHELLNVSTESIAAKSAKTTTLVDKPLASSPLLDESNSSFSTQSISNADKPLANPPLLDESNSSFSTRSISNADDQSNIMNNDYNGVLTEPREERKGVRRPKNDKAGKSRFSSTKWLVGSTTEWLDYKKYNKTLEFLDVNNTKHHSDDVNSDIANPKQDSGKKSIAGGKELPKSIPHSSEVSKPVQNVLDQADKRIQNITTADSYNSKQEVFITKSQSHNQRHSVSKQVQNSTFGGLSPTQNTTAFHNASERNFTVPPPTKVQHFTVPPPIKVQNFTVPPPTKVQNFTVLPPTKVPKMDSTVFQESDGDNQSDTSIKVPHTKPQREPNPEHILPTKARIVININYVPGINEPNVINDSSNNEFCALTAVIITPDGPLKFRNITECWTPRFTKDVGLLITFFPVGISALVSLYGLYLLIPGLNKEFIKVCPKFQGSKYVCRCILRVFAYVWQLSVVVVNVYFLTIFTTLFDVFDVFMDFSMGYKLEIGEVIERHIYREVWVINFIFVFAFLGVIKIAICLHILRNKSDKVPLFEAKSQCYCIGFLLEDCGEMFLEYFYIETYLTSAGGVPWFLLTRNTIYCLLSVRLLFWHFLELLKKCYSKESDALGISFFGTSVIIGLASLTRTGGAIYQTFTGHLKATCLKVVNGKLMQTPFDRLCMKAVNYPVLILTFTPLLLLPGAIIYYNRKNNADMKAESEDAEKGSVILGPADYPALQAQLKSSVGPCAPVYLIQSQSPSGTSSQYAIMQSASQQQYQIIPMVGPMVTSSQAVPMPQPLYTEPGNPLNSGGVMHPPALVHLPYQAPVINSYGNPNIHYQLSDMLDARSRNKNQQRWNYAIDHVVDGVRRHGVSSQKRTQEARRQRSFSDSYDQFRLPYHDQHFDCVMKDDSHIYEDLDKNIKNCPISSPTMSTSGTLYHSHSGSAPVEPLRDRVYSDPTFDIPIYVTKQLDNDSHSSEEVIVRAARLHSRSEPSLLGENKMGCSNLRSTSEIRLSCLEEVEI